MKRILLFATLLALAFSGAMVSCYFDAARDNVNDPESDNYSPYNPWSGIPIDNTAVYMFAIDTHTGDLGGRTGADALCASRRSQVNPNLPSNHVRAFISVSDTDEIKDMRINYGVPELRNFKGPGNAIIATNWNNLLGSILSNSISGAKVTTAPYWWSGSDSTGGYWGTSGICTGWIEGTISANGAYGVTSMTSPQWLSYNEKECSNNYAVLCICWND